MRLLSEEGIVYEANGLTFNVVVCITLILGIRRASSFGAITLAPVRDPEFGARRLYST
jgi:hypothetical protein